MAVADTTAMDSTASIDECWRQIGVRGDRTCPELAAHLHCRNCPTFARTARQLLDRPLPPGYREEWTRFFAGEELATAGQGERETVLIFRIGEEWLALPVGVCVEIAEPRPVRSLPHRRSAAMRGIVNVRGELLVCLSLAELLGVGAAGSSRSEGRLAVFRRLVVIGGEGGRVAFEADEVHGLHGYDPGELGPVPATIGRSAATAVTAMLRWSGRAVGCLDARTLLDLVDRSIG
jgi:chemotaxis-related protein WspD